MHWGWPLILLKRLIFQHVYNRENDSSVRCSHSNDFSSLIFYNQQIWVWLKGEERGRGEIINSWFGVRIMERGWDEVDFQFSQGLAVQLQRVEGRGLSGSTSPAGNASLGVLHRLGMHKDQSRQGRLHVIPSQRLKLTFPKLESSDD